MSGWIEDVADGLAVFRPEAVPPGLLVAFSGRGVAPGGEPSPTSFLARRFARALGLDGFPMVRATQVHGVAASLVREAPEPGIVRDAGECDVLATTRAGVGLAVQTADCVPILLAGKTAVSAAHAGWRGSAEGAAKAALDALARLGARPGEVEAWIGPSIGACCYEVGGEVAARFARDFLRSSRDGRHRLDLREVNRAQLVEAGVARSRIFVHPGCTFCGGEKFASFRRDGAAAGRMIALIARLEPGSGGR